MRFFPYRRRHVPAVPAARRACARGVQEPPEAALAAPDRVDAVAVGSGVAVDLASLDGVDGLLAAARVVLGMELTFLARIDNGRMAMTAVSRNEAAGAGGPGRIPLAAGDQFEVEGSYCARLVRGEVPASIPDAAAHPVVGPLPITGQLGIGAYCGVPVRLPGGELYGTLCGLHPDSHAEPTQAQLATLHTIAGLVGHRLALEVEEQRRRYRDVDALLDLTGCGYIALQPIVDLADHRVHGFEALSRFSDEAGHQSPQAVFARAEELGCTTVVEQGAARKALDLLDLVPRSMYLSLNLSPSTLLQRATLDLLSTADLSRLVVEVTEHEHVDDYAQLTRTLAPLRARGLRLAVDDTGAGFAGLQHLARLAPDIIKLDIAFVRHADTEPTRRAVARAVAGFAREVGAVVVAEGIETPAEAHALQHLGAAFGQGFLFGGPRPAAEALSRATHIN